MMDRLAPEQALIFLHIPKSAGTTVNRLIEGEYPLFEIFSVDPVFSRWSCRHLWSLPPERLKRFRILKGHMLFGLHKILPQPATYFAVFRDPINRVISAFYFMRNYILHPNYWTFRRLNWQLEDFVRNSPRDNVQTKIVAGAPYEEPCTPEIFEQAKQNLCSHFSVVGLSERFEESLALMKVRYGWKLEAYHSFNITRSRPRKRELPQAILDLIAEKNAFDIALYQLASELFHKSVEQNATAVNAVVQSLESARIRNPLSAKLFSLRAAARKAINRGYSALYR
jgi:Sulfotransferase family